MYYKPWDRTGRVHVNFKGGSIGPTRIITEDMKAAAEVATKQWNDYQTRFAPFENKFFKDITKDASVGAKQIGGMTNADMAQKNVKAALDPTRVMPSASKFKTQGTGMAAGALNAENLAKKQQVEGLQTAVAMGRGQAIDSVKSMTDRAIQSSELAQEKQRNDIEMESAQNAAAWNTAGSMVGAVAGAGAAGYKASNAKQPAIPSTNGYGGQIPDYTIRPTATAVGPVNPSYTKSPFY